MSDNDNDRQRSLFLAPCRSKEAYRNFHSGVLNGIDFSSEEYQGLQDITTHSGSRFKQECEAFNDNDVVRLWGIRKNDVNSNLTAGSIILFYTKKFEYEYAVVVRGGIRSQEVAREIWSDNEKITSDNIDHLLILSDPLPVRILGDTIQELGSYEINWVISFAEIREQAYGKIADRYGGIKEFIQAHSFTEPKDRKLVSEVFSQTTIDDPSSGSVFEHVTRSGIEDEEDEGDEITSDQAGKPTWFEKLSGVLRSSGQATLVGPPDCVGLDSVHAFRQYIADMDTTSVEDTSGVNIRTISLADGRDYDELVESADRTADGPIKRICKEAYAEVTQSHFSNDDTPPERYLVVLKDLGDQSPEQIFGRLLEYMEPGERQVYSGKSKLNLPEIRLPESGEHIHIPDNLAMIAIIHDVETYDSMNLFEYFPPVNVSPEPQRILYQLYQEDRIELGENSFIQTTVVGMENLNAITQDISENTTSLQISEQRFIDKIESILSKQIDSDESDLEKQIEDELAEAWRHLLMTRFQALRRIPKTNKLYDELPDDFIESIFNRETEDINSVIESLANISD